jgi:hypothetical protein
MAPGRFIYYVYGFSIKAFDIDYVGEAIEGRWRVSKRLDVHYWK